MFVSIFSGAFVHLIQRDCAHYSSALESVFFGFSHAQVMDLCIQFQIVSKNNSTIDDYLMNIKLITDHLIIIGESMVWYTWF